MNKGDTGKKLKHQNTQGLNILYCYGLPITKFASTLCFMTNYILSQFCIYALLYDKLYRDGRTDGRTHGRTENMYSIFRDKLLLLGEHGYVYHTWNWRYDDQAGWSIFRVSEFNCNEKKSKWIYPQLRRAPRELPESSQRSQGAIVSLHTYSYSYIQKFFVVGAVAIVTLFGFDHIATCLAYMQCLVT